MADTAKAKLKQEPLLNTLAMSAGAAVIAEATTLPFDTAKVLHCVSFLWETLLHALGLQRRIEEGFLQVRLQLQMWQEARLVCICISTEDHCRQ